MSGLAIALAPSTAGDWVWQMASLASALALPVLVAIVVGGLVASLIGLVTQLNESSIALLARLCGLAVGLVLFGRPLATRIVEFASAVFASLGAT